MRSSIDDLIDLLVSQSNKRKMNYRLVLQKNSQETTDPLESTIRHTRDSMKVIRGQIKNSFSASNHPFLSVSKKNE